MNMGDICHVQTPSHHIMTIKKSRICTWCIRLGYASCGSSNLSTYCGKFHENSTIVYFHSYQYSILLYRYSIYIYVYPIVQ